MSTILVLLLALVLAGIGVTGLVVALLARREARESRQTAVPPRPPAPAPARGPRREDVERLHDDTQTLRARLDRQEGRLAHLEREVRGLARALSDVAERPPPAAPPPPKPSPPPPPPREIAAVDRVRAQLEDWGYSEIAVLRAPGDETLEEKGRVVFTVEAERAGLPVKGLARVQPDGRVEASLKPVTRAFP